MPPQRLLPTQPRGLAMTCRLDDMLVAGERVVYRELPGWNPRVFWIFALVGPVLAGVLALGFFRLDPTMLIVMAGLVVGGIIYGLFNAFFILDRSRESLITDRRVLHKAMWEGRPTVTAIPLADIAAVDLEDAVFSLTVIVGRRDKQASHLPNLRRAEAFAVALAEQAELPPPPSVGRLEHLALYCSILGGVAFGAYFEVLLLRLAPPAIELPRFADTPLLTFGAATALVLGAWLGTHLAALLAVVFLPLFASAEQAGNWLRMRPQGRLAKWLLWKNPLHFKLAGLVYGQRLIPTGKKAERHGA